MSSTSSPAKIWTSRIMSGLAVTFMVFDSVIKVIRESHAVESTVQLGYPESAVVVIGIIETLSLLLYVIPQTSAFGAVLLTGYLGGAVAIQFRLDNPLFSHTLFPVYIAVLLWGSLYLREPRLKQLIPFRTGQTTI